MPKEVPVVQVDVFWSYGIGAGVALARARQLGWRVRTPPPSTPPPGLPEVTTFLACAFAPSGIYLVTAFPHWETMHVARTLADLPPWLITAFAVTNVTQGILGYTVGRWLIRRGTAYLAYLQWCAAYLAMFWVLVHGWDGTGYQRFFSARPEALEGWTWADAVTWLGSDVALTLYAMGLVVVPWLLALMARPIAAGCAADPTADARARHRGAGRVAAEVLALNTAGLIAIAVAGSLAVRTAGPWLGGALCAGIGWVALVRPGSGLLHRHFRRLMGGDDPAPAAVDAPAIGWAWRRRTS